jgi:hypothetical protein
MQRGVVGLSAGVFAALFSLAACNAINGASDLAVGESAPRKDAAAEAAPPEPDDGGTTGAVSCGDQRVCLTTPSGWSPLVLVQGAANALCPTTWAQKTPVKAVRGTSTCSCRCGPTFGSGSCEAAVTVVSGNAACTAAGPSADVTASPDGGCTPVSLPAFTSSARAKVAGQAPTSCGPQLAIDAPQPIDVALCAGADVTTSPKCRAEESCVPAVSRGARLCIARDGEIACPAGGWTRWSTGTNPSDTRACEGCTCAVDPAGCSKGELAFFSQDGCTGANGSIPTDDACKPSTVTAASKSVRFRASTGCTVTQEPRVAGALAFTGARTVCCL